MNLALLIYVIQVILPAIESVCIAIGLMIAIVLAVGNFRNMVVKIDYPHLVLWDYPFKKRNYAYLILLLLITGLIPSKEVSYAIVAAYGVQTAIENPKVQEVADNSLKVLDKYMKEYLEEGNTPSSNPKE